MASPEPDETADGDRFSWQKSAVVLDAAEDRPDPETPAYSMKPDPLSFLIQVIKWSAKITRMAMVRITTMDCSRQLKAKSLIVKTLHLPTRSTSILLISHLRA